MNSLIHLTNKFIIMKRVTLWLMKRALNKAEIKFQKETNEIVKMARKNVVEAYKATILFLNTENT